MDNERFSRQILAFGEKGQKALEEQSIAIVGAGGLGSLLAQGLAYKGIKRFVLIDDDVVTTTTLNRSPGMFPEDVGKFKVFVTEAHIKKINASAQVAAIPMNLRSREALSAVIPCSAIFGSVDRDGPRLILMELAAAYEIPYIDCASEIFPEKEGQPFDFGGRVVVSRPGDFCLDCANQLDRKLAKEDLETPEECAVRRKHGYGFAQDGPSPSVISLNGVIANLGLVEFMAMVTGLREPARHLSYRGMRGVVTSSKDVGKPDCFTCKFLRGQRENANIWRYALSQESTLKIAA
jgi:molybdopterin/thiamine biosynthesis adenylyltransferase